MVVSTSRMRSRRSGLGYDEEEKLFETERWAVADGDLCTLLLILTKDRQEAWRARYVTATGS